MRGAANISSSPATIFVVDDDKGLARLVEKTLQREGFLTASAGSFQEAADWLQEHQPDLMLLDLKLEDIGGTELVDYLTVSGKSVPFIIITGQGDERVAVAMMKRGAIDYLVKDVDFLHFVPEVVRRALGQLERDRKLAAAEEALRRSEANLAKAQQIAHLGSYELNVPPSGNDYRSEEIYRILGLDVNQRSASSEDYLERMVHPADRERYRTTLAQAIVQAAPFSLEYRVVRSDGSVRHVQSVGEPVVTEGGRVTELVGTLLDITERKRGELRQRVQYATTQSLAESPTLDEAAPRILKAVCETLDWDCGEFWQVEDNSTSLSLIETWRAESVHRVEADLPGREAALPLGAGLPGQAWSTGKPVWVADILKDDRFSRDLPSSNEIRCAAALPVLLRDEVLGVVAFYCNVVRAPDSDLLQMFSVLGSQIGQFIERKRAEEALRKEHAFSSAVLDTSAALVVVLDRRGDIVRFNRACEKATGYTADEVKGRHFFDLLLVPEELDAVKAVFDRLRSGHFPSRNENHCCARDGTKRLIAWSNSVLLSDDGDVEYIISIGIDVTERRRLEHEILQISEMEQRRIGQDLHDGLCQHLAATELMSEILGQKLSRKSKADAARVEEIARQVREAISQTRLLARGLSPVALESEGLMSALEELAAYTRKMFRVNCEFVCEAAVLVEHHGRATHLYRIAQEAVSNAVRHGKAKRIVISLRALDQGITLQVRDDGIGLPKDVAGAKGMGLRIMQYRAAMVGGSLRIQNEANGGTAVRCTVNK